MLAARFKSRFRAQGDLERTLKFTLTSKNSNRRGLQDCAAPPAAKRKRGGATKIPPVALLVCKGVGEGVTLVLPFQNITS